MAYSNLKAEMARKDITIESMAQMLGIHRNSVANKLNGASSVFDRGSNEDSRQLLPGS